MRRFISIIGILLISSTLSSLALAENISFRGKARTDLVEQTYLLEGALNPDGLSKIRITFDENKEWGLKSGILELPQDCETYPTNYYLDPKSTTGTAEFRICDLKALPAETIFDHVGEINHFEFDILFKPDGRYLGVPAGFSRGSLVNFFAPIPLDFNPEKKVILLPQTL